MEVSSVPSATKINAWTRVTSMLIVDPPRKKKKEEIQRERERERKGERKTQTRSGERGWIKAK